MRLVPMTVVTLALFGCSGETLPIAPPGPAPPARLVSIYAVVIDNSSALYTCVAGATVEIVRGQGAGRNVTQHQGCYFQAAWDDHNILTFPFRDLNEGQWLTMRASAPGYSSVEVNVLPSDGGWVTLEDSEAVRPLFGLLAFRMSRIQ